MDVSAGAVDRMWDKLGFSVDYTKADVKAVLVVDGRVIAKTLRSHGSGKIRGNIPHFIRQQMRLNEQQFSDAINCPLQKDDYLSILRDKGLLP